MSVERVHAQTSPQWILSRSIVRLSLLDAVISFEYRRKSADKVTVDAIISDSRIESTTKEMKLRSKISNEFLTVHTPHSSSFCKCSAAIGISSPGSFFSVDSFHDAWREIESVWFSSDCNACELTQDYHWYKTVVVRLSLLDVGVVVRAATFVLYEKRMIDVRLAWEFSFWEGESCVPEYFIRLFPDRERR